ncbi:hypothetical protein BgiMline_006860 [Biomphalaria glabrata]|nr:hypothetical protein BgiMline_004721 [Biomphalaria glabrata]
MVSTKYFRGVWLLASNINFLYFCVSHEESFDLAISADNCENCGETFFVIISHLFHYKTEDKTGESTTVLTFMALATKSYVYIFNFYASTYRQKS